MHAGALTVLGRCVSVRAMARDLPHGTVTLMFTDIEGSTRLLRELGDGYADVLAEHRQRVREVIAAYRGAEVDTQGDAFFVAFTRASDAASAAADIQQALRHGTVSIRIGLHTGEPAVTDEAYVGIDVHRGARIMSAGHAWGSGAAPGYHTLMLELDDALYKAGPDVVVLVEVRRGGH